MKQIIEAIRRHAGNRDVVLWGKYKESEILEETLSQKYNIKVKYYVDSNQSKVDHVKVKLPSELNNNKEKNFVICILPFYDSIYKALQEFGYEEEHDFIYHAHKPIIVDEDKKMNYVDKYGNKIIGDATGCEIIFYGYNATIEIGKQCKIDKQVSIRLYNSSKLKIGDNVTIDKEQEWVIDNYGVFRVGDQARIEKDGSIFCGSRAKITIDKAVSIGRRCWLNADYQGVIEIGKECMISHDVVIRTNDGHGIFDIESGKNICNQRVDLKQNQVSIDEHVWIGTKAVILYGTRIRKGSVVGASSITKRDYPNNCIIAGIPGRVIKKNIAWSKESDIKDIGQIDKGYISYTLE